MPSGSFFSHVLTLLTGTAIAQGISLLGAPVLTRQYNASEFGIFALFVGVGTLVSVISTGRYEYAIVLPESNDDAINLLILTLFLVALSSVICGICIEIYLLISHSSHVADLYLIPLYVLFTGTYQSLNLWNNRLRHFDRLSISRIILSVGTVLVSIGFGYLSFNINGLFIGAVAGQGMATLVLGWWTIRDKRVNQVQIDYSTIRRLAKEYCNFPKINVAHAVVDNINATGTVFFITYFFGATIVGYYSLMMRILQSPSAMISSSISQVFYQRIAEAYASGNDVAVLIRKLIRHLSGIVIIPAFIILLAGPFLFGFIFGEQWTISGKYAQVLIPFMCLYFIVSPLTLLPLIVKKQKEAFFMSAIGNILFIISIVIGAVIFKSMIIALAIYSIIFMTYAFLYINWVFKII